MRIVHVVTSFQAQQALLGVLLYVGPDLILPLTSALAAVAGALLLFWNRVVSFAKSTWRVLFLRNKTPRG